MGNAFLFQFEAEPVRQGLYKTGSSTLWQKIRFYFFQQPQQYSRSATSLDSRTPANNPSRHFPSVQQSFKMQLIIFLTAALAAVAQAADVCGASGSSCGGTLRCCNGIAAGSCCRFGASTSVRFTLPANRCVPSYFPSQLASEKKEKKRKDCLN